MPFVKPLQAVDIMKDERGGTEIKPMLHNVSLFFAFIPFKKHGFPPFFYIMAKSNTFCNTNKGYSKIEIIKAELTSRPELRHTIQK